MGDAGPHIPSELPPEPAGSWSTLFQHAREAVFLLSRRGQIRYLNPAWEALTGRSAHSMRGLACRPLKKKGTQPVRLLLQVMAPPVDIVAGRCLTVRRPAPPAKAGPPWWDITFIPLGDDTGHTATIGLIHAVAGVALPPAAVGLSEALIRLRQQAIGRYTFDMLHSDSPAMQRVELRARLASTLNSPVWINGEAGTGRHTLARIIHFNGLTRDRHLLPINAGSLQPFLIRSMIFGAAAMAPGSVMIRDPHLLPADLQAEIVEWYHEQELPPRVVVCGPPDANVIDSFRVAFDALRIELPPLRERLADLPRLAGDIMRHAGHEKLTIAAEALDLLRRHQWSGNLNELWGVLGDAASGTAAASGVALNRIEAVHLPLNMRVPAAAPASRQMPPLDTILEEVERRMIVDALRQSKGNKADAADRLGIPRARLLRRIESLKIAEG